MTRFAVDTGPLVALLNRRDGFHQWASKTFDAIDPPLRTCEPVISEACFLVRGLSGGAEAVLALIERGLLVVDFSLTAEAAELRTLMARYQTVPMSLADACLVRMTELDNRLTVVTLDHDFHVYRRHGRQSVPSLMP